MDSGRCALASRQEVDTSFLDPRLGEVSTAAVALRGVVLLIGGWLIVQNWDWLSNDVWNWLGAAPNEEARQETNSTTLRNIGLVVAGLIALPLAVWRSTVAHRQAEIAQRGLLNERYQKGAEMLGNDVLSAFGWYLRAPKPRAGIQTSITLR